MLIWRGDSIPHFVREPDSVVAMILGFAVAGYLRSAREARHLLSRRGAKKVPKLEGRGITLAESNRAYIKVISKYK